MSAHNRQLYKMTLIEVRQARLKQAAARRKNQTALFYQSRLPIPGAPWLI